MSELLRTSHYIDGAWRESAETYAVRNPATGEVIANVARGGAGETKLAIEAAVKAFPAWRAMTAKERGARVRRWGELMLANRETLAALLTREQGKPLAEALGEVAYAASFFEWFAEEAKRSYGDVIPSPKPNSKIIVTREPVGVVAAITPWNFPLAMITRKAGPALAAGCTMVLKPPRKRHRFAPSRSRFWRRKRAFPRACSTSFPAMHPPSARRSPNPRTCASCRSRARRALVSCSRSNRRIRSRSCRWNWAATRRSSSSMTRISTPPSKAQWPPKFRNTGQTCVCVNRFYVQDGVYDTFTQALTRAVHKLRAGNGLHGAFEQGPLINEAALDKVKAHVADAVQKGAKVLTGGKPHTLGGTFYEPTVLADATPSMLIAVEETFGPVAACFRFRTEDEVIRAANDTPYGLAAYFYTRDLGRAWRVADALETGLVGINEGIISTEVAPFGGVKQSGLGREGSKYGLDEYTELKYMMMAGLGG